MRIGEKIKIIREDKNYKDVLLEKKVSKIADLTINIILLIIATLAILYAYATNKINENNHFAVIVSIIIIIHTSIYLYKRLFKKWLLKLTSVVSFLWSYFIIKIYISDTNV